LVASNEVKTRQLLKDAGSQGKCGVFPLPPDSKLTKFSPPHYKPRSERDVFGMTIVTSAIPVSLTNGTKISSYAVSNSSNATSRISMTSCKNGKKTVLINQTQFIAHNLDMIKEQVSQGKGHYINALAYLMGCSERKQKQFNDMLRLNYSVLFVQLKEPNIFDTSYRFINIGAPLTPPA